MEPGAFFIPRQVQAAAARVAAGTREFANKLQEKGANPYGADGETTIDIPSQAFEGRTGNHGKTFAGKFDLETGILRIDCAEAPEMWLQIDFTKSALWYQPDNPGARHAVNECVMNSQKGMRSSSSESDDEDRDDA